MVSSLRLASLKHCRRLLKCATAISRSNRVQGSAQLISETATRSGPGAQVPTGRFLKWRVTLTEGSREMILTVLSTSPTARKRDRCSPGGTLARLMHTTSADISFRSVYSFSCPDYRSEDKSSHKPLQLTPNHGLRNWKRPFKFLFASSHSSYYNQ